MSLLLLLGLLLAREPIPQDPFALPPELPRAAETRVLAPADPALAARLRVVHWPGDEARAERVLATIEGRPTLPGLPPELPGPVTFFLAPDPEIWAVLTGGAVPDWGAGVAVPSLRRAVIPVGTGPLATLAARDATVLHEWAHLGLHQYLEGLRIPRWFDEGYAQWASEGWRTEEAWRLRLALAGGAAPPLDSLALTWPADRAGAEVAYLLSASAVEFLVAESGARGMGIFLTRWRDLEDFELAFRETFGTTTGSFETRWAAHVRQRYGWILVLSRTAAFWVFAGIALLILFRIRRRRDRERLARLRATEPPDDPAWWEGPPGPPIGGFTSDRERWGRG